MGRYGGNWTWYEYRAIQTLDHLFNEIRASEGMFGLPLPRGVHSWCCVTSSLSICTAPPAIGAAVHQRRKQNFSLGHRTSRVVLFNEINDETGCKLAEACRMENGTVIFNALVVTTCDIIKGIMTLLYHHGIDFHKWSVHICIISLHVMYQLISVAYILYIYTHQHQSFEYTVCKVILPLAHGHPQCILRATSLNDPRSTEQAYRQKECGQGAFPKRDAKKPCQDWPKRVNTKSGKTMQ